MIPYLQSYACTRTITCTKSRRNRQGAHDDRCDRRSGEAPGSRAPSGTARLQPDPHDQRHASGAERRRSPPPDGVSGWWMPTVSPEPEILRVSFGDIGLDVRVVAEPELVVWDVVSCSAEPDWVGTTIEFAHDAARPARHRARRRRLRNDRARLHAPRSGRSALRRAMLRRMDALHPSLVSFLESGAGNPGRWR